jgi:hypothetical protein
MLKFRSFSSRVAFALALTFASAAPSAAVNCCSLNGGPCNIIPPLVHGTSPWTGSACPTTISGTNCDAELSTDVTLSSGTCITLGSGVTFDFKGNRITCTDDDCTAAVRNSSSGASSDKVIVKGGEVFGCFQRGLWFDGGTNSTVEGMYVDLARDGGGNCNNGGVLSAGVFTPRGTTSRTSTLHAFTGFYLQPGEDLLDSLAAENYVGIGNLGASAAGVALTNVQLLGNGNSVKNNNPGVYIPTAQAISLQNAVCHCLDASNNCVTDITDCFDFTPSNPDGNASFIDYAVVP